MSKTHRAQIPPHVRTNTHNHWCLYSFRLSQSHTPKRSPFLRQPAKLQLSPFLSISPFLPLTSVWETDNDKDTCLPCCLSPSLKQNRCLEETGRTFVPDVLLNVLMWLNVPSEPTTLGRELSFVRGLCGSMSRSALLQQTRSALWACWLTPRQLSWFNCWTYHCGQSDQNPPDWQISQNSNNNFVFFGRILWRHLIV